MPLPLCMTALLVASAPLQSLEKEERPRGMVIVIGGIGGIDPLPLSAKIALPAQGVPHIIYNFRWTHGLGKLLRDLQDVRHLMQRSEELANVILRFKKKHPLAPVYIVSHSAGSGIALFAAAKLPPATLETVVLLSAAVSPDFDLRPALRATRKEIVAYYSPLDRFCLLWGTTQFGTTDRVYGPSAGFQGFAIPAHLSTEDALLYQRLRQISWKPKMFPVYRGFHNSPCRPAFLGKYIAPLLK